jgi:hypothetical protein
VDVPPEGLTLSHHRELEGRARRPLIRQALLVLLGLVLALGLFNVFGQRPREDFAASAVARFEVSAPTKLRGGLFFQARFRVVALEEIGDATIVLHPDWLEGITLNTVEPAPIGESSRDGRIAFELGRIPAGDEHRFYLQFQVNPTAVGKRSQTVELFDGERLLVSVDRDAVVWP